MIIHVDTVVCAWTVRAATGRHNIERAVAVDVNERDVSGVAAEARRKPINREHLGMSRESRESKEGKE